MYMQLFRSIGFLRFETMQIGVCFLLTVEIFSVHELTCLEMILSGWVMNMRKKKVKDDNETLGV